MLLTGVCSTTFRSILYIQHYFDGTVSSSFLSMLFENNSSFITSMSMSHCNFGSIFNKPLPSVPHISIVAQFSLTSGWVGYSLFSCVYGLLAGSLTASLRLLVYSQTRHSLIHSFTVFNSFNYLFNIVI